MPGVLTNLGQNCLSGAKAVWTAGVGFVYPSACPLCGVEDGRSTDTGPSVCWTCRRSLLDEGLNHCPRCGAPVGPHLKTQDGCLHCRRDRFAFDTVYCLGVYRDELREPVVRGKQPGGEPLIASLGKLLCERWRNELTAVKADWIVPIPHHWRDRLGRAHNAAETLGRVLARCLKVDFGPHILAKVRHTPPQSSLRPTHRRSNLRNAFRVRRPKCIAGRTILLADDVLTTGTTAQEASKVLRQAGAARVVAAVLARGVGQSA